MEGLVNFINDLLDKETDRPSFVLNGEVCTLIQVALEHKHILRLEGSNEEGLRATKRIFFWLEIFGCECSFEEALEWDKENGNEPLIEMMDDDVKVYIMKKLNEAKEAHEQQIQDHLESKVACAKEFAFKRYQLEGEGRFSFLVDIDTEERLSVGKAYRIEDVDLDDETLFLVTKFFRCELTDLYKAGGILVDEDDITPTAVYVYQLSER